MFFFSCRKSFIGRGWVSPDITHMFNISSFEFKDSIISNIPFFIPLDDRFKIFHDKVSEHKEYVYPLLFLSLSTVTKYNYLNSNNYYGRMQTIKLHRSNLFDEAYHTFSDKSKSFQ